MEKILQRLKQRLPEVEFAEGQTFCWSPLNNTVTYQLAMDETNILSLLHEAAHALLDHKNYRSDFDLLLMEVAAWQKASELASEFGIHIDEECIQDRLDTYRDWLHQRSTCPRCSTVSLQTSPQEYRCSNCQAIWHVSTSRFCRPYRLSTIQTKKSPRALPKATFQ